jgi:hypothetical protein
MMSQHKLSTRNLNGRLEQFMWNADWMIGYPIVTELNYGSYRSWRLCFGGEGWHGATKTTEVSHVNAWARRMLSDRGIPSGKRCRWCYK